MIIGPFGTDIADGDIGAFINFERIANGVFDSQVFNHEIISAYQQSFRSLQLIAERQN